MEQDLPTLQSPNGPSLTSLYDDALMAVLLRTRASDHFNLRLSCKRIRDIIDSVQFRKERSVQGFAEVEVDLLTPFEQYQQNHDGENPPSEEDEDFLESYDDLGYIGEYKDYSFETNCFRVFVDGRPIHKLKKENKTKFKLHVRLLPLRAPFWEVCDCYNQALCDLGTSLFTDKGKPKIGPLKDALARVDDQFASHDMLYIDDFYVPFEYRMTASTVGPLLIKKVLQLFIHMYSIAMYIPFRKTQFTEEDAEAQEVRDRNFRFNNEMTDAEIEAKEEWELRNAFLKHQDMRQFFRAGFYQVDERSIVESSDYSYVFTTPDDAEKPILSVEEAMSRPVARKTPPRPEPKGLARELRLLVELKIIELNEKMEEIKVARESPRHSPRFRGLLEELTGPLQQLRDQETELSASIQQRTQMGQEVADLEERSGKVISMCTRIEETLNEACSQIEAVMTEKALELETSLETVKAGALEEMKVIIEKSESPLQIVLDSDVIHLTAAGDRMDLLGMIVELLPASEQSIALNGLDRAGLTPLMVAASVALTHGIKARENMVVLMNKGADKNIVHASSGLSALGHFRESRKQIEIPTIIFGFQGLIPATFTEEASRTEALLMPINGPSPADDSVLVAKGESDSDFDDDEFDY